MKCNIKQVCTGPQFPNVVSYSLHGSDRIKYGFIAQELEDMFPLAVTEGSMYKMTVNIDVIPRLDGYVTTLNHLNLTQGDLLDSVRVIAIDDFGIFTEKKEPFHVHEVTYQTVKMVDYKQILMGLVLQVKELTNHHSLKSKH